MDYDNGFILQKTMVSSNRSVDWSLLNDGMIIPVPACAHISYFTRSQNNDSTNIIIISPNYHRIIHKKIQGSIAGSSSSNSRMVR